MHGPGAPPVVWHRQQWVRPGCASLAGASRAAAAAERPLSSAYGPCARRKSAASAHGGTLDGTTLTLRENGDNLILGARAFNADGGVTPLKEFPVVWSTSDSAVIEIFQTEDAQTRATGRNPGTAKITAVLQGVSAVVDGTVRPAEQLQMARQTAAASRAIRGRPTAP